MVMALAKKIYLSFLIAFIGFARMEEMPIRGLALV
jgi:hypothetical protein